MTRTRKAVLFGGVLVLCNSYVHSPHEDVQDSFSSTHVHFRVLDIVPLRYNLLQIGRLKRNQLSSPLVGCATVRWAYLLPNCEVSQSQHPSFVGPLLISEAGPTHGVRVKMRVEYETNSVAIPSLTASNVQGPIFNVVSSVVGRGILCGRRPRRPSFKESFPSWMTSFMSMVGFECFAAVRKRVRTPFFTYVEDDNHSPHTDTSSMDPQDVLMQCQSSLICALG